MGLMGNYPEQGPSSAQCSIISIGSIMYELAEGKEFMLEEGFHVPELKTVKYR